MKPSSLFSWAGVFLLGAFLGWGLASLIGGSAAEDKTEVSSKTYSLKLERDNESLRRHIEHLEKQVSIWESANVDLQNQIASEVQNEESAQVRNLPSTPAELGSYVGSIRKRWEEFKSQYSEQVPTPEDPDYNSYLASFQEMVSQSAVLGAQMSAMSTYDPEQFAQFHAQYAGEFLGLDQASKETIAPLIADLVAQLNESNLGRDSYPSDESWQKRREWYRSRNQFERESTKLLAANLPPELQQKYIEAFDDDIFESGISDMLREMRSFTQ
ncbi:MAG: hypothetical protein AAFY98_04825 [Verrucomicrobiota bacterium]